MEMTAADKTDFLVYSDRHHCEQEALDAGCNADAPGSYAAWLSHQTPMHAWKMTGGRHDIGDMKSYEAVRESYKGPKG